MTEPPAYREPGDPTEPTATRRRWMKVVGIVVAVLVLVVLAVMLVGGGGGHGPRRHGSGGSDGQSLAITAAQWDSPSVHAPPAGSER